jgi:hypothetical protein
MNGKKDEGRKGVLELSYLLFMVVLHSKESEELIVGHFMQKDKHLKLELFPTS